MRLTRSAPRPANIDLSLQFQRCQVIKSARLHAVLFGASNLAHESNIQWRGRSYVASAPSDTLEERKRRRVPKDERKSMVENYVKKYREMNAGKFPTISDAKKYVGGSYYVVREILQELKYNSKMSCMDPKDATSLEKSAMKKDEISSNFGEVSETRELGKLINPISEVDTAESLSKSIKSKEGPRSSISVEMAGSKDVRTQYRHQRDEPESSLCSDPENNIKHETVHEDELKFDGLQPKAEPHGSIKSEISGRKLHKVPTEDEEPPRKPSVWQNLKSFASGVLGLWKRS